MYFSFHFRRQVARTTQDINASIPLQYIAAIHRYLDRGRQSHDQNLEGH